VAVATEAAARVPAVDPALAVDTIGSAGAALSESARVNPEAPVPTCQGWTVATVVRHVGLVHRWAATVVSTGATEAPPFPRADTDLAGAALTRWADAGRAELLDVLARADPDRAVWAFGTMRPARFWWRRQAQETALHAWDATAAVGEPWAIPSAVASAGIEEILDWLLPRRWAEAAPTWGEGRTVHLHRTDGDGEWLVTIADPPVVALGHVKGDLAIRGTAPDLLLWVTGRVTGPAAPVELFGDLGLAESWTSKVTV